MGIVLVFNGPPGSGKDEAAQFLVSQFCVRALSFKYQLFLETFKLFGVTEAWFMNGYDDRAIKERPEELLGGRSRRQALIHTSEDVLKPMHGKDVFGKQAAKQINKVSDYCFSDCGFSEELRPVINTAGATNVRLIQLFRDGSSFANDSRRYVNGTRIIDEIVLGHQTPLITEHFLTDRFDSIETYRLHNNGKLAEFHQAVKSIYLRGKDGSTKPANSQARTSVS